MEEDSNDEAFHFVYLVNLLLDSILFSPFPDPPSSQTIHRDLPLGKLNASLKIGAAAKAPIALLLSLHSPSYVFP